MSVLFFQEILWFYSNSSTDQWLVNIFSYAPIVSKTGRKNSHSGDAQLSTEIFRLHFDTRFSIFLLYAGFLTAGFPGGLSMNSRTGAAPALD